MAKSRSAGPGKQQRLKRAHVRGSQLIARWLAFSFIAILGALLLLAALDVRLGQGFFAYRYSPVRNMRALRALPPIALAAMTAGAIWYLSRARRRIAYGLLIAALLGATAWLWWAPPQPLEQHAFNLRSLSSDGAFVEEAEGIQSIRAYLQDFEQRVKLSPSEMGGTRILSNPPGMTVLTYGVLHAWPTRGDRPAFFERIAIRRQDIPPELIVISANSLKVSVVLTAIWMLAVISAYFLGRVFLSPTGAVTFAAIACFNPCVVLFVPGKDPAQLLTIHLMLLGWLAAWKLPRATGWAAALGGAALAIGSTFGLVHIWVALAAFLTTAWDAMAQRDGRCGMRLLVNSTSAATGAALVCLIAYATLGWNIPSHLQAVYQRFGPLQETFTMSRPIWYLIGLPIFLLFLSPGFLTLLGLRAHRRRIQFGARLALCTSGVMLLTYALGVTYELPRLWVVFLPPLTLGLMIDLPLMKFPATHRQAAQALMLIVAVQIVFTAFHWTMFDVRESEYRLLTKRFYQ